MKKCNSLEELVNYIMMEIMQEDYDRYLNIIFGEGEILMYVFENQIPIQIKYHEVYEDFGSKPYKKILAEVYAELLQCNIGRGWLKELDEICIAIDENSHIFEKLLTKS